MSGACDGTDDGKSDSSWPASHIRRWGCETQRATEEKTERGLPHAEVMRGLRQEEERALTGKEWAGRWRPPLFNRSERRAHIISLLTTSKVPQNPHSKRSHTGYWLQ